MEKSDIHESHDIEEDYEFAQDPHNPAWFCRTCRFTSCVLCSTGEGLDDDELAAACLGYSHWDSRKVIADDGITRTVKKSGTGWPKLR